MDCYYWCDHKYNYYCSGNYYNWNCNCSCCAPCFSFHCFGNLICCGSSPYGYWCAPIGYNESLQRNEYLKEKCIDIHKKPRLQVLMYGLQHYSPDTTNFIMKWIQLNATVESNDNIPKSITIENFFKCFEQSEIIQKYPEFFIIEILQVIWEYTISNNLLYDIMMMNNQFKYTFTCNRKCGPIDYHYIPLFHFYGESKNSPALIHIKNQKSENYNNDGVMGYLLVIDLNLIHELDEIYQSLYLPFVQHIRPHSIIMIILLNTSSFQIHFNNLLIDNKSKYSSWKDICPILFQDLFEEVISDPNGDKILQYIQNQFGKPIKDRDDIHLMFSSGDIENDKFIARTCDDFEFMFISSMLRCTGLI